MNICIVTQRVMKGDGQGRVNYEITWEAVRRGHCVTLLASQIAPDLANTPKSVGYRLWSSKFQPNFCKT